MAEQQQGREPTAGTGLGVLEDSGTPQVPRRLRRTIESMQPEQRLDRVQRLKMEREAAERAPGMLQSVTDAVVSEWGYPFRALSRVGFSVDPDYMPTDDEIKQLGEGIDPEWWDEFESATSASHALRIREQLLDLQGRRQRLGEAGWTGAGLRMGAMIFDPTAIAVSVGAFKAGGPAVYGANLTRLQRFIRSGLVAGTSMGAVEAAIAKHDPDRTGRDVLWTSAGAFALGGAGGLWAGGALERVGRRMKRDTEFLELLQAAVPDEPTATGALRVQPLTPKGRAYFADQLDPKRYEELADLVARNSGLDPEADATAWEHLRQMVLDSREQLLRPPGDGTATATAVARAPDGAPRGDATGSATGELADLPSGKIAGDLDLSHVTDAPAAMAGLRRSFASILGSSESADVRRFASAAADDALLKADGSGGGIAATTWRNLQVSRHKAQYYRVYLPEFKAWRKEQGYTWARSIAAREQFNQEVVAALRQPRGSYTSDPHINRVADQQRQLHANLLGLAQRHGVKWAQRVKPRDTYVPRIHDLAKLNRALERYGDEALLDFYAGALRHGSRGVSDEEARAIARGYMATIRRQGDMSEMAKTRLFEPEHAEELATLIRAHAPEVSEAQLQQIVQKLQPREEAITGVTPRLRPRVRLSETYQHQMPDGSWMSLIDLTDNNAERLAQLYTSQMVGNSAITEVYRLFRTGPEDVIDTWQQMAPRLRRAGATDRDIELLETLDKYIRGIPINKNTTAAGVLRKMRGLAHIAMGGQFGVAQVGEAGNTIAEVGARAMFQQVPALRHIFRRMRNGQMSDELLEWVDVTTGLGDDALVSQIIPRMDLSGAAVEFGGGVIEQGLRRGQRVSNFASFMYPINTFLHRATAVSAAQWFTNAAFRGGGRISAARRQQLGLSKPDMDRVIQQLRTHATTEEGMLGRRLRNPNTDAWTDQQAASKFIFAIDRWSRRAIQTDDIGNLHPFVVTDAGKVLFQFRRFVIAAWERQFLSRVQMRDWQAWSSAMLNAMVAGLAYSAQQFVLAQGRADVDEVLAERLAPAQIARAAVQRSAWSSILPGAVDTFGTALGADSVFTARNTGLTTDFFFGSPVTEGISSVHRGARGLARAARGEDELNQADMRALFYLAPLRNVFGIKNVIDATTSQFPE